MLRVRADLLQFVGAGQADQCGGGGSMGDDDDVLVATTGTGTYAGNGGSAREVVVTKSGNAGGQGYGSPWRRRRTAERR